MSSQTCTPAPPPPHNGPSDWFEAVRGNCFSNIERLGQWTAGTNVIGSDPSGSFQPVVPGSIGVDATSSIYVLTHGWAPGYRAAVTAQGGNLLWWSADASIDIKIDNKEVPVWASDWAWSPVTGAIQPLQVNGTGLLQSIMAQDPSATVLAYSWIDDSATDSGGWDLTEVYQSEAYTHVNGIRLAQALTQAITPTFWNTGVLRLIGHSHGSKVATIAALVLQRLGYRVAHLTILDAPDDYLALSVNGANLLGFYLDQIQIGPPSDYEVGLFLDNYASYFGVSYAGTSNLKNIVEVMLDSSSKLYSWDDVGGQHSYAAGWYGGAASESGTALGLAWPPVSGLYSPALDQTWPGGAVTESAQWQLTAGRPLYDTFSYTSPSLAVNAIHTKGNVSGDPATGLVFGAFDGYSIFHGAYQVSGENYGVAFDLLWIAPRAGDYFVVCMDSDGKETALVLDGQSGVSMTSVAINNYHMVDSLYDIYIYFFAAQPTSPSRVRVTNFRSVFVQSASGYLEARRRARREELRRQHDLAAPGSRAAGQPTVAPGN